VEAQRASATRHKALNLAQEFLRGALVWEIEIGVVLE
jgi:hypothetical protein